MFTTSRQASEASKSITCLILGYIGGKRSPATRAATTLPKLLLPGNDSLTIQKGHLWCVFFFASKRKLLVCFLFDLNKEALGGFPFFLTCTTSFWVFTFYLCNFMNVLGFEKLGCICCSAGCAYGRVIMTSVDILKKLTGICNLESL